MKRVAPYLLTSLISLAVGGLLGAAAVRRTCDRDMGHDVVFNLMNDGWAAREIYQGRGRQHADRLRESFPNRVLGVEHEWRQDEARNTAFRVVSEAYSSSGADVPVEIRKILATVPPRPSREVPPAVK
jgi:hypothetical protein